MKKIFYIVFLLLQVAYSQVATLNITINESDDLTADADLAWRVYNDPDNDGLNLILFSTKGSANNDADVTLIGNALTITNVVVSYDTQYYFRVAAVDEDNVEYFFNNTIAAFQATDTTYPILSNFRIDNATPDRVYFDADQYIDTNGFSGFTISGKTITSITNTINGIDNYLTVSAPFTFWDNNTIQYNTVSNEVEDNAGNDLLSFTLSYIQNNIVEPTSTGTTYYIDAATGNDSDDGLSEVNAWQTFDKLQTAGLVAGDIVYIKAGVYSDATGVDWNINGVTGNPIKILGYKTTPGDLDNASNYYSITDFDVAAPAFSTTEMPTLDGGAVSPGGLDLVNSTFLIIKNIQITQFGAGIFRGANNIVLERVNIYENYGTGSDEVSNFYLGIIPTATNYSPTYFRYKDCYSVNSGLELFMMYGSFGLMENCVAYNDKVGGGGNIGSDYYFSLRGDHNIVRNCKASPIDATVNTSAHGFTAKGAEWNYTDYPALTSYNLFELNWARGSQELYCARNSGSQFNVFKDNEGEGFNLNDQAWAVSIQTGASDNTFERNVSTNIYGAIRIVAGAEENGVSANQVMDGNIVRNNLFDSTTYVFYIDNGSSGNMTISNSKFYNNTFHDALRPIRSEQTDLTTIILSNNELKNNIFSDVVNDEYLAGTRHPTMIELFTDIDTNNFWNSWVTTLGSNSININPNYNNTTDLTTGFLPSNTGLNIGLNLTDYDFLKVQRRTDNTTTLGFKEI